MSPTAGLVAWSFYDWANSAFPTVVQTFVFAAYFTRQVAKNPEVGAAQWGLAIGIAGLFVALGGPVLGAVADNAGRVKPWIAAFTFLSALLTGLLWFVTPSLTSVWWGLGLVAIATIGSEFAELFYNSLLPDLAPRDRIGRWSGWAWGLGYAGGLVCLVVVLFGLVRQDAWVSLDRTTAQHVRAAFPFVAVWTIVFALPLFLATPDVARPGRRFVEAVQAGLKQLAGSLRDVRQYGPVYRFLIARMIFIDGLATLFAFGGVYAAGEFAFSDEDVLWFGIGLNVTAGLGAAAFAWIDDRIGGKRTIEASLLGLIAAGTALLAVREVRLFWIAGLALGVFVGPAQAAGRSYLARTTPKNVRTQTFGLYALSGRATAFAGPLLVGWITYLTGSQRAGMAIVVILFAVGLAILRGVPADKPAQSFAHRTR